MRKIAGGATVLIGLSVSVGTHAAGGHFGVDDAFIVDAGRCEIETWYSRGGSDDQLFALVPACNPWGNLEIGLGASREQVAGDYDTLLEFSVKTQFREMERGGFAWGLAAASTYGGSAERVEGAAVYVPLSVHVADNLVMNYNLGWARQRDVDDVVLWGIGGNYSMLPRVNLIAEAYRVQRGGPEYQAGLRFALTASASVDLSYGRTRSDRHDDWTTVGFAWAF